MTNITAHMVVRNEDKFIWYAISSVLPYVDEFFIFDTNSTDRTVEIVRLFDDKKIIFKQKGEVDAKKLVVLRQEQIDMTKTDWIWIVDGDEVYPKKTAQKITKVINSSKKYEGIIVHRYDLLGDIYHFQNEMVGTYDQFGKKGHYVLRLINKKRIEKLKVLGNYPNEYFADATGQSIKNHGKEKFAFVHQKLFHAMYLERSSKGRNLLQVANRCKFKIEWGRRIPKSDLPEVFFQEKPSIVPDITKPMTWRYKSLAFFITPVKRLKRKIGLKF